MIHAGALKKFGLYGLLRIAVPALPVGSENWMMVMVWLCLGNLILVGLAAMRQKQLHMLVGFSSVAHMGFIFMGLAVYNHIGVTGALLVMVAHGYLAALSFGVTGLLRLHHPDLDMSKMGGILKQAPYLGFALAVAFFAGCGVPGFANFAGEVLIFFGAWKGLPVAFVVPAIWSGLIIGGVYMLRAYRNVLHGPVGEKWANLKDPQGMPRIGCNVLIIALIFFGIMPSSITKMAAPSIDALISQVEAGRPQATVMGSTSEPREIGTDISGKSAISAAHPTIASNTNP
jgi:NADH-quinone oxidoreductase subunit M